MNGTIADSLLRAIEGALHSCTAGLIATNLTIEGVGDTIKRLADAQNAGWDFAAMKMTAEQLATSLEHYMSLADEAPQGLSAEDRSTLIETSLWLREYEQRLNQALWPSVLGEVATRVWVLARDVPARIPRTAIRRKVLRQAGRLEGICCVMNLQHAKGINLDMFHRFAALRHAITQWRQGPEEAVSIPLDTLVSQAIRDVSAFAQARNVKIHRAEQDEQLMVMCAEREVRHILIDILHLMIRSAGGCDDPEAPFIELRFNSTEKADGMFVKLEIRILHAFLEHRSALLWDEVAHTQAERSPANIASTIVDWAVERDATIATLLLPHA